MKNFFYKIKQFFIQNKLETIIFGGVALLMFLMLLANSAWPFGSNTLAISDTHAQIAMIFEHIFDALAGKTSLFYNARLGGGTEVLSFMMYMLLNPFFLVVLPFGRAHIFDSINFVIIFSILFNTIVVMWFLKKYFKNLSKPIFVILSLMYTFNSYIIFNFAFMTWLIYPSLILLLFDAFKKLEQNGKTAPFIIMVSWVVINSFVVGVASNFLILAIIVAYVLLTKEKQEQKEMFTRVFVSYVVAICVCVIVLLPEVISISGGERIGSFYDNLFSENKNVSEVFKIAIAVIDLPLLLFSIYYFVVCDKKNGYNKFLIVAFVLGLLPNVFDGILKLHFLGNYVGFPARINFVMIALEFCITCKLFSEKNPLHLFDAVEDDKTGNKTNGLFKFLYVFMIVLFVISTGFVVLFKFSDLAVLMKNPITSYQKGSHVLIISVSAVMLILFVFAFLATKRKLLVKKIFSFTIYAIMIFSCVLNYTLIVVGAHTKAGNFYSLTQTMIDLEINGRVKSTNIQCLMNNIYEGGSIDYFSSTKSNESNAYSKMGYPVGVTSVSSHGGTLISDSLLGLEYMYSYVKEDRPYLKEIQKVGDYYLYQNTLAGTGVVLMDRSFKFNEDATSLENMQAIANGLGVTQSVFENVNVKIEEVNGINTVYAKNVYKISYTPKSDGVLYTKIAISYSSENVKKYLIKKLETDKIFQCDSLYEGQTDLGFARAGEELVVYLTDVEDISKVSFTFMDYSLASEVCEKIKTNSVNFEYTKNGYKASGNVAENKSLLVFMCDIEGMNYKMNGEDVKITRFFDGFVQVAVQGEFELEAGFKYKHTRVWIIVACIMFALAVAVSLLYHFTKFKHAKGAIRVLFMSYGVVYLSIFVLFGIIVTFL